MLTVVRSRWFWCLLLLGALGGGGAAYLAYSARPEALLRAGRAALERGDGPAAARLAGLLEARGHPQHARALRGELWVRFGRSLVPPGGDSAAPLEARPAEAFARALEEL